MLSRFIYLICGDPKQTPYRIRFLNGMCAMSALFGLGIGVPVIAISGLGNIAFFVLFMSMGVIALSYYFARFNDNYSAAIVTFQIGAIMALNTQWFQSGGLSGSVPYYFIIGIGAVISISDRPFLSFLLFLSNITMLVFIEYNYPELIQHYEKPIDSFIASTCALYACSIFMMAVVTALKKASQKVGDTTIDSYEKLKGEYEILARYCEALEERINESNSEN